MAQSVCLGALLAGTVVLPSSGCSELPPVRYESARVRVAPYFDDPVCAGTLARLEGWIDGVEVRTGLTLPEPVTFYWGPEARAAGCDGDAFGCALVESSEIYGLLWAAEHELAHVVGGQLGVATPAIEEGWTRAVTDICAGVSERKLQLETLAKPRPLPIDDEARATHFVVFLIERFGIERVNRFKASAPRGSTEGEVAAAFESAFDVGFEQARTEWLSWPSELCHRWAPPAGHIYTGGTLELGFSPACDDPDTLGPYAVAYAEHDNRGSTEIRPGMYQSVFVDVPFGLPVTLTLDGPAGSWMFASPTQCWDVLAPRIDLEAGESSATRLQACRYAVGSNDVSAFSAVLHIAPREDGSP